VTPPRARSSSTAAERAARSTCASADNHANPIRAKSADNHASASGRWTRAADQLSPRPPKVHAPRASNILCCDCARPAFTPGAQSRQAQSTHICAAVAVTRCWRRGNREKHKAAQPIHVY
jgi:hypothetical protein